MPNIPQTKLRLQPYITISTIKSDEEGGGGAQLQTPEDILSIVEGGKKLTQLGAIQKVDIKQTRTINQWRNLDASTYGKIVETYPGLPNYSLTLDRLVLYEENVLEAFGFDGSDLIEQFKPFLIIISLFGPETAKTEKSNYTWIYHNCWFENFGLSFDIEAGNLKMNQSTNVATAGVIPSKKVITYED